MATSAPPPTGTTSEKAHMIQLERESSLTRHQLCADARQKAARQTAAKKRSVSGETHTHTPRAACAVRRSGGLSMFWYERRMARSPNDDDAQRGANCNSARGMTIYNTRARGREHRLLRRALPPACLPLSPSPYPCAAQVSLPLLPSDSPRDGWVRSSFRRRTLLLQEEAGTTTW